MSDWDKFLEEDPGTEHTQRVMSAARAELRALRPKRRLFLAWLAPAAMAVAGVVVWRVTREESMPTETAELSFISELEEEVAAGEGFEESLDLLDDMDWMEDLEVLEKWTSS